MWVLLDDEGEAIRYYTYQAKHTVEVVEKKLTLAEMFEQLGECLL